MQISMLPLRHCLFSYLAELMASIAFQDMKEPCDVNYA